MNSVALLQQIRIGLWVLLAASSAYGANLLHIDHGTMICAHARMDIWGVERPNWSLSDGDSNLLAFSLQPYAAHGINTVGLSLQDSGLREPFFRPDGRPSNPNISKRFTEVVSGIRNLYLGVVINMYSAEPESWLTSPDAYREAARQVAALLPEHHSTILVVGDLFGTSAWQPDCPYPLNDLDNVIELAKIIKKKRSDCLIGIPANIVPGSAKTELLYVTSQPEALAIWAHALRNGKDPRQAAKNVVTVRADHFLLRRDMTGNDTKAFDTYAKHVKQSRLAVQVKAPTSMPSNAIAPLSAKEQSDGWQALFDGRSLHGWTTLHENPDAWIVEEGVLTCRGTMGAWLRTRRQFGDFHLRLEFKIMTKGNSGIFLRAPLDGRASRFGMEMQIRGLQGQLDNKDSTGAIYDVLAPSVDASKPAGEWNEVDITCVGPKIAIRINGQRVQDFDMNQVPQLKHRLRHGAIGLQDHGDHVSFRNIRIKSLD